MVEVIGTVVSISMTSDDFGTARGRMDVETVPESHGFLKNELQIVSVGVENKRGGT